MRSIHNTRRLFGLGCVIAALTTAPVATAQFEQAPPPLLTVPNADIPGRQGLDYTTVTSASRDIGRLCKKTVAKALRDPNTSFRFAVQNYVLAPKYLVTDDNSLAPTTEATEYTLNRLSECGFLLSGSPNDEMERRVVASDHGSVYTSAFSNGKFVRRVKKILKSNTYSTSSGTRINFGITRHLYETDELDQQNPRLYEQVSTLASQLSGCKVYEVKSVLGPTPRLK